MFHARAVLGFATMLLAASTAAGAQQVREHQPHFQFIISSGKLIPTGAQRAAIQRGNLSIAQLAYVIDPAFAVTASIGWARTRDVALAGNPKLDLFTYDVGGEVRAQEWLAGGFLSLSPFGGIGVGGRSYNHRSLAVDATHNLGGYASAGGEIGIGSRVKLRVEARNYVTGFRPLSGGGSIDTRNDVSVIAGLRVRVR